MGAVNDRLRVWGGLLLGLGLAVLLAGGALWSRSRLPAAEPLPFIPLAADKSPGVNTDLSRLDAARREEVLAAIEASGFRWLRQRFPWDRIEPQRGDFDWAVWDEIMAALTRHNLTLIAVLDGSPAWARAAVDADNPLAPPIETHHFGDFVAAFAARYGDQVDYYQIWDEPNIAPHWGAREIDPAAYARLLREGAVQVRAADPGAVVLLAALAPNVEPGGANMSELSFLDALYRWGAAEWFDVVAVQPYDFGQPLDAAPDAGQLNWQRAALLREVMEAYGDAGTAVWAVSFGTVSSLAAGAVEQARQAWPWLGPMLWAAWSPDDLRGQYAPDAATRDALRAVATAPPRAWPGAYPADHPGGRYEGGWRVTPAGADIGGSGDRLTIPFWGTRLDLMVRRGDYRAFLFVTVDGRPANALPRDVEGRAYVVLYDPAATGTQTVTLARSLPAGEHVAEIVAERGWGQWAIVGWAVVREAPSHRPWLPAGLGLAALIVLVVTLYQAWPHRHLFPASCFFLLSPFSSLSARYHALDDRLALALTAGAALLAYVMVGTVPTLAALALLGLLLLLRPEMGLPLIALALPFYQLGRPLLGKVFSMVEILTLLTALGWVFREAGGKGQEAEGREGRIAVCFLPDISRFTALDWSVMALVAMGALSLLWAEHGREAAREFRTVVLEAGIFYALLRAMVRTRRDVWRLADAWMLGAALIALVGVGQWLLGANLITAEGVWRVRGFYGSPNNLALYLGRAFPLAVAVGLWARGGRRRWLYGLAALAMAAALFLTYSRGAWLVGMPAALLFLAAMRGRRTLAVAVGLLLVVAALVLLLGGAARLTSLLAVTEGTTWFRLQLWRSSLAMLADHPLLGVGLDNFLYAYRSHYVLPTAWEEFNLSHPHNFVLDFWLRLGLPGLAIILGLLVGFFRRGWWVCRRSVPEEIGEMAQGRRQGQGAGQARGAGQGQDLPLLVLGLMGGMVNFVAHGLVDNAFFLVDLASVFVLMVAMVQVEAMGGDHYRVRDVG